MRIGVLTHNYPRFPGDFSGVFIEQLCDELARQGETIHVIAPFDPAYDARLIAASPHHLHLYRYIWPAPWHRLGYMRTMQADVRMRLNTYALSPLMVLRGIQTTLHVARKHHLDLLHAHWAVPNGFIGATVSRLLGIPLVVSIPGSDALVADANVVFRRMVQAAFDQAGLITANSESLRDVAIARLGADPAKFELVIYGVDPNKLHPDPTGVTELRARLGIPADAFVALAVGRMVYKKGFDILLQALARIDTQATPLHTVLIGEGDLWADWQQLARDLGLRNVHWVGNVPTDEMPVFYNAADVLVMPNVTRPATGLGVTVLDAMACGKAILGSDTAGNTLVVEPGVNGLITPEGDADALAAALLALASDPDRTRAMGRASRRLIETRFGWPHIARHYRKRYRELISGSALAVGSPAS